MNLENLRSLKLNSLNTLNSLNPLITAIIGATSNFLSEGVRLGLDMKIARMGHTSMYFPFGLLIERSRMTPYHKKLLDALVVLTSTSINADLVTSVDEQRYLNSSTCVYCSRLE